jgi:Leucine-rich repeat (LRR) protein
VRGITNTGSYLKNRLVKAVELVCVRVKMIFMTIYPGTPNKLGSLSFSQLANHRTTDHRTRIVVDTFVADCFNKLINSCRHHPDMLTVLEHPNRATITRENAWDKLMELYGQLPILTAYSEDTPLSTVLSMQVIRSSIERTDKATVALRDALLDPQSNTDVSTDLFDDLRSMTKASDIRDWLRNHPRALDCVTTLILTERDLEVIPSEIQLFPHLIKLNCDNNPLSLIHKNAFEGLNCLESLDLSFLKITQLPPKVFKELRSLKNLYLINNDLMKTLPEDVFKGLPLEILSLWKTPIAKLPPEVFKGLASLQTLNLSTLNITSLPDQAFAGLYSLEILDLSHLNMTSFPPTLFTDLRSLKMLDLSHLNMTSLPDQTFQGLNSLTYLNLSNTGITRLPSMFFRQLPALEELHLKNTRIKAEEVQGSRVLVVLSEADDPQGVV